MVAILGPTAVGKTAVAVELCLRTGGEIVSIDSRQVYRGIEVCSNAPTAAELHGVACHLVGVLDPRAPVTAASYVVMARAAVAEVRGRGRLVVLTAGTGLYLRALLDGLDLGGHPAAPDLRAELESEAQRDLGALVARLAEVDPHGLVGLDIRNPVRVVRRFELALLRRGGEATGAEAWTGGPGARIDAIKVGLDAPREALYARVDARTDQMLSRGWRDEVRALLAAGVEPTSQALRGIGIAELSAELAGRITAEAARDAIARRTRNYAKRQLTWFRAEPGVTWFDVTVNTASDIVDSILELNSKA